MKPLYIFDLDGTLANIDHRRHLIADKKNQRWDEFYSACVDDEPNIPVIQLFKILNTDGYCDTCEQCLAPTYDLLIFSGRSEVVKTETIEWLVTHAMLEDWRCKNILKMRRHGDNTPDEILKRQWYDELSQEDKDRLVCVFDDRQKVVDMWRSIGVTCLQVAAGNF